MTENAQKLFNTFKQLLGNIPEGEHPALEARVEAAVARFPEMAEMTPEQLAVSIFIGHAREAYQARLN